ncbi:MAG: acyl-CoA/acyl-ACP dehydrogenase [Syntrophales bacterium]|nr:acyl-CoA/acyl-ACP dehydrogenase [Syntrophales bacterium]
MKFNTKNFKLPEQLDSLKAALPEFVQTEIDPIGVEMNRTRQWSNKLFPLLREAGLLGLRVPKEYGGYGLTYSQYWPLMEELAKTHGGCRMPVHGQNGMWGMIHNYGTKEQKKKYLSTWLEKQVPVFALTEPETGTGVDIKMTATKQGDYYILNGTKWLISFSDIGTFFHVVCYTGDRSLGAKGISMILVDAGTPGMEIEDHGEFMGCRASAHHIVRFKDCKVPVKNLLGQEGQGLEVALKGFLDPSRLSIAISCLGACQKMLELSVAFAKQRITFGKPIADRQAVQMMLADMAVDIHALRTMIADCTRRYDAGEKAAAQISMCKLFGVESTKRVSDNALLIHGGIGTCSVSMIEQLYRDVRELWFEEGTPTVQRTVIGRDVLGKAIRSVGK